MGLGLMKCDGCGRRVSVLTLGLCQPCIEAEMERAATEAKTADALKGGEGRTVAGLTESAEFLCWVMIACVAVLAAWGIWCALKGGA
jgi:hypothetical protein